MLLSAPSGVLERSAGRKRNEASSKTRRDKGRQKPKPHAHQDLVRHTTLHSQEYNCNKVTPSVSKPGLGVQATAGQ